MLVLVFGIVEFIKTFGVKGKKLRLIALAVGVAIAVVFKLRELIPSATVYIDVAFFAITAGLAAGGLHDYMKKIVSTFKNPPDVQ